MIVLERKLIPLMLLLELITVNLSPISTANPQMAISSFTFESCHPSHAKSSSIFSQSMRMRRNCSKNSYLNANVKNFKDWFRERGYPEDMVNNNKKDTWKSFIRLL